MLLMTTIMMRLATVGVIVVSTLTKIRNDLIVRIAAHDDDHDRDHGPHLLEGEDCDIAPATGRGHSTGSRRENGSKV